MLGNISFPEILPASGMLKLAKSINSELDELLFKDVRLPELPPRDITTILNLAEAGLQAEISVLEWISLLNGKEQWDTTHFNQERKSNELIWQLACSNHGLRYLLYWRFAVHLDGLDVSFSKGLIRQFAHFQKRLVDVDKQRTLLLSGIYSGDTSELCKSSLKLRMVPVSVLNKCGLPGLATFSQKALKGLAQFWVEHAKQFGIDALFAVINKLKSEGQDMFFSSALLDIPIVQLEQQNTLVNHIVSIYSPYIKDSRFNKLSQAAQQVVRDLIGAMSFGDFSKLIAKLTETEVVKKLGLEEWEVRQLNSRVAFWSNYQSRFLGFSVFLPSSTYTLLKQLNIHTDEMLFHQLNNTSCEVCVLEFDNHFILEFLRGGSSGVRVIDKHSQEAHVLKNVGMISSQQQLETIPFLAEHDHLIYWQNACEKLLRTKFNLTPSKNIRKFLITQRDKNGYPFYQEYSSVNGLPNLTAAQLLEREEVLRSNKRKSSKFTADKSQSSSPNFVLVKNIIQFFNENTASGGWFGYSEKHGWIIEIGGSTSGLVFKCLSNSVTISVSYNEFRGSKYMKVVDYLNSIQDVTALDDTCMSLVSIVEKIPITSVRSALANIISNAKLQSNTQHKMAGANRGHNFSEDDLIS